MSLAMLGGALHIATDVGRSRSDISSDEAGEWGTTHGQLVMNQRISFGGWYVSVGYECDGQRGISERILKVVSACIAKCLDLLRIPWDNGTDKPI